MLKSSYITFCLVCLAYNLFAQTSPTFVIDQNALALGHATVDANGYSYKTGFLSVFPSLSVKSNEANLSNTIPVSYFTMAMTKDGVTGSTLTLSTASQQITSSLLGLFDLSSGPFTVKYSAPNLSSFAWKSGSYHTTLSYIATDLIGTNSVTPGSVTLTVNVPAFIAPLIVPEDIELLLNNLNYFRTTPLSADRTISVRHSVPLSINLKGNASLFTFSGGYNGLAQPPQTNINTVNAKITVPVQGSQITLNNASQAVSTATVTAGNTTSNTVHFSITPANMLAGFINKGTYTNAVNLEVKDAATSTTYNKVISLKVIVSDLSELSINTSAISLKFTTADDYRNGVIVNVPNHLVVSRTTPYDITVKADKANFQMGSTNNNIPVSVLTIGPSNGQSNVNTISSISSNPQDLISAASPIVDRNISLQYRISPSQTPNLFNKKTGTYTANIIYTLTAH